MNIQPIGFIESPFEEKFGAPRQPGLVPAAQGAVRLLAPWDREEAIRGLEAFSHIWVIYGFDRVPEGGAKTTVRPPRLGGNERIGILASRSPFRENRLGLSVVKLLGVEAGRLEIGGLDMVDGSPVFDVKPYLPWAESIPEAEAGFAVARPEPDWDVEFAVEVADESLRNLIAETLAQDPRPAFHEGDPDRVYGMNLAGWNVQWRVDQGCRIAQVLEISPKR